MGRTFRDFHDLGQHAAHILGMQEEDQGAMRADTRLAQHLDALGLEIGLGGLDIRNLEADMVLPAQRVLREKNYGSASFRPAARSARSGCWVYRRTHPHALRRHVERIMDFRRAHDVAVERGGFFDRRGGDPRHDSNVRCSCSPLHDHGNALATADAHGDQAITSVDPLQFVDDFDREDRTGRADRMTERDAAAIGIELDGIEAKRVGNRAGAPAPRTPRSPRSHRYRRA